MLEPACARDSKSSSLFFLAFIVVLGNRLSFFHHSAIANDYKNPNDHSIAHKHAIAQSTIIQVIEKWRQAVNVQRSVDDLGTCVE